MIKVMIEQNLYNLKDKEHNYLLDLLAQNQDKFNDALTEIEKSHKVLLRGDSFHYL